MSEPNAKRPRKQVICVTGASGYIASHVVKQLLEQGYTVRGTVRDTSSASKTAHLVSLPGAAERLQLVQADLNDAESMENAIKGCSVCFHTASPFFNSSEDPDALIRPAVDGTLHVLRACHKHGIREVMLTSSTASVMSKPEVPKHRWTEADWSDKAFLEKNKLYYPLSKTLAEEAAWKFVTETAPQIRLVSLNPCLVIGPMLQPSMNTSSEVLLQFVDGTRTKIPSGHMMFVDVRDVARAHILAWQHQQCKGRFILWAGAQPWREVVAVVRQSVPDNIKSRVPSEIADPATEPKERYNMLSPPHVDTTKAQTVLGLNFIQPLKSIEDLVKCEQFQKHFAS